MNDLIFGMNILDVAMLSVVLLSMIIGTVRGFVKEALSLMTWLASSVVAVVYFQHVGDTYLAGIQVLMLRYLLAGILLSLGTLILGGILNYFISNLIQKTNFKWPDRMIGAVFGCARGLLLLVVGVLLTLSLDKAKPALVQSSVFFAHLVPAAHWVKDRIHIPEKLKAVLDAHSDSSASTKLAPMPSLPEIEKRFRSEFTSPSTAGVATSEPSTTSDPAVAAIKAATDTEPPKKP